MNKQTPDLTGISLLIVDNSPATLRSIKSALSELGATVYLSNSGNNALELIENEQIHVVLSELNLKECSGMECFEAFKKYQPEGIFYLMSDNITVSHTLQFIEQGVADFFTKPVDIPELAKQVTSTLHNRFTSVAKLDPLVEKLRPFFIFRSPVMKQTLAMLPKVSSTMQSVLITGETGTGKEMIARAIHSISPMATGPFVALNCGAIPEGLIEGELFGHEKGAFTSAHTTRKGKFELAQNGTLLLDEIGDMPLILQVRLLRALEEGQIYRVGGEKPVPIKVRILAATRANLEESVQDGLFREDLYYRLNVLRLHLPPLREREEDIPILAWHFLNRAFDESGHQKPYPHLTPETINLLKNQFWKGNVRELRNVVTRIAILLPPNTRAIQPENVIPHLHDFRPVKEKLNHREKEEGLFLPIGTTMEEAEEKLIEATLAYNGGNRTHTAAMLGIGLRTLRRKLNS